MLGIDYSFGRPTGAAVKAAGYGFVARYLSTYPPKNITAAEYADMQANGVAVVLVWETTAQRMLAGWDGGVHDAQEANRQALAVGHPGNGVIYFACDWDATPAQQGSINAYLDGAASQLGRERVGVYGGYWPLSRALDAGKATYAWQTQAWSGTNLDSRRHITQRVGTVSVGGVDCDVDEATCANYGQHPCPELQLPQEDPMSFTPIAVPPGVNHVSIPYETGKESAVVAAAWLPISAAWGDLTGVRVWCGHDDGTPAGVDERFDLPSNQRHFVRLPDDSCGVCNVEFTRHPADGVADMSVGLGLACQPK